MQITTGSAATSTAPHDEVQRSGRRQSEGDARSHDMVVVAAAVPEWNCCQPREVLALPQRHGRSQQGPFPSLALPWCLPLARKPAASPGPGDPAKRQRMDRPRPSQARHIEKEEVADTEILVSPNPLNLRGIDSPPKFRGRRVQNPLF